MNIYVIMMYYTKKEKDLRAFKAHANQALCSGRRWSHAIWRVLGHTSVLALQLSEEPLTVIVFRYMWGSLHNLLQAPAHILPRTKAPFVHGLPSAGLSYMASRRISFSTAQVFSFNEHHYIYKGSSEPDWPGDLWR